MRQIKVKRESIRIDEDSIVNDSARAKNDIDELKKDIHEAPDEFESIPVNALRNDKTINCDIFTKVADGHNKILSKPANISQKIIDSLIRNNHKMVYAPVEQKEELHRYLEDNLHAIIHDEKISKEEKSEIIYASATDIVEELFSNPITTEAISRTRKVVKNILDSVLSENTTINSLIAVSSYDYYTYTHSVDVSVYALGIGKELRMNPKTLSLLAEAAILHDIGKSRININIVNKPGRLNDEEFMTMKMHSQYSYDILVENGVKNPAILTAARDHHEKLNGKGYPNGISAKELSKFARIIAIADIFNALTTRRAYKPALTSFKALSIMKNEMNGELDDDFLRVFIKMMSGKKI